MTKIQKKKTLKSQLPYKSYIFEPSNSSTYSQMKNELISIHKPSYQQIT